MGKIHAIRQHLLSSRWLILWSLVILLLSGGAVRASEADLAIPDLHAGHFTIFGMTISAWWLLFCGALVITGTLGISLYLRNEIHKLPAHKSMLDVAEIIFQTCKTYLIQQGKFLLLLFALIACAISYYLVGFGHEDSYEMTDRTIQELRHAGVDEEALSRLEPMLPVREHIKQVIAKSKSIEERDLAVEALNTRAAKDKDIDKGKKLDRDKFLLAIKERLSSEQWSKYEDKIKELAAPTPMAPGLQVLFVLLFSVVGMAGSYAVAWYGIRVNTYANCRTAFASLRGEPWDVVNIPLRSGMSIGLFLISLELVMMVIILLFVPRQIVGVCFLGFAIGESLGASALRIAGGIFTKIADIGSDLMKIVFNVKEDDPRNPGVIADCTGDNAGDSVGPTADGFETYGVTGVALIAFITLAVSSIEIQAKLIVWIFAMRFLMDFMSGVSYFINQSISEKKYKGMREFDFEQPLTRLIWIASILCITTSFLMSLLLISDLEREWDQVPQPLVATGLDHQLRNPRGRANPRVHQSFHQLAFQARA